MFERFSEPARQVVVLAQDEARTLRHNYIGTEHLLLGLLREGEGIAARVLATLGVNVEEVRAQVARIVGQSDEVTTGQIPFTPRAKKVLELALSEALSLGHNYVGTEHLLLGIVRENEGVAARILLDFGSDAETVRNVVSGMLSGSGRIQLQAEQYTPTSPPVASEVVEEIERVRAEKETAIEEQEFERAARLRERERWLTRAARNLEHAWSNEPGLSRTGSEAYAVSTAVAAPSMSRKRRRLAATRMPYIAVILGWVLFGGALGFGILIGWGIWG